MLGQLARQEETDCGLNLPAGDGRLLVVLGQPRGFSSDLLEDVIHERVHDAHGLAGDASLGVHLLQHLVDVDGVGLLPGLSPLLLLPGDLGGLDSGGLLLALCSSNFAWHFQVLQHFRIESLESSGFDDVH